MIRRAFLLAPMGASAQAPLVLQGTATRRYLGFRVYEARLYLPRRAMTPAEAADPCEIQVHYLRAADLADVRRAWVASLGALDTAFDAWLRPLTAGDQERFAFSSDGAWLQGPGRPAALLPPGRATAALRASWIGPQAPAALTRGWFPAA